MESAISAAQGTLQAIREELARVLIGQERAVDLALTAICCGQHALLEGVPGVAKTLLVRTLAVVLGCPFNRVQFTPDLMPADILGTTIFDLKTGTFTLCRGPVFTTFLLADEINRAPAKTQSALLQAMQEREVTIDRSSHPLSPNFAVFATQNPVEFEGTYPLPEAQLDRFLLKIEMGPPGRLQELELAARTLGETAPEAVLQRSEVRVLFDEEGLTRFRRLFQGVMVSAAVQAYGVDVVRQTRQQEGVLLGAGPRATQGLLLAARVMAVLDGRDFVTPDDIKGLAAAVLGHRLILHPEYAVEGMKPADAVAAAVAGVPVPR